MHMQKGNGSGSGSRANGMKKAQKKSSSSSSWWWPFSDKPNPRIPSQPTAPTHNGPVSAPSSPVRISQQDLFISVQQVRVPPNVDEFCRQMLIKVLE